MPDGQKPPGADDEREAVMRRAKAKIAELQNAPLGSKALYDRMLSELGVEDTAPASDEDRSKDGQR